MTFKRKFPATLSDMDPQVTYEEMLEKQQANPVQSLPKTVAPRGPVKKKIPTEPTIPKSQLDSYIQKKYEQLLRDNPVLNPPVSEGIQKHEIIPKKVEAVDDLPEFERWVTKDRIYVLCTGYSSLSHGIKDRHKKNSPLMYKGRSLRYSTSQASFFMDKQVGDVLLSYLSIEEGRLLVPKENTHLQKFLAIHPDNGIIFKEFNPEEESKKAYESQNITLDAHFLSRQIDSATLVSVAMLMWKDYNETMDMFTVKRALYNEIEANPKLFIKLASDPNLKLKSIGKIAVNRGLLSYANFRFTDENNVVICEANRNENEYETLASYFSTAEGRNLYDYLVQKIEF